MFLLNSYLVGWKKLLLIFHKFNVLVVFTIVPVTGPTTIPPKCVRKEMGNAPLTIRNCTSNTTFLQTRCGGYCDSSAVATHGNNIYTSECTCCSPSSVIQVKAFMKCGGIEPDFDAVFSIIESCDCTVMSCSGNQNVNNVKVKDESGAAVEQRRRKR